MTEILTFKTKNQLLSAFLCVLVMLVTPCSGARDQGRSRDPGGTRSDKQAKQEQAEAQAKDAAENIDSSLVDILEAVNKADRPDAETIDAIGTLLKQSRRFARKFDDKMQCEYYMLSAWHNYFDGKLEMALKLSAKAYKTDIANNDARLTQTALAILADQKPVVIKPPKEKTSRTSSQQRSSEFSRRESTAISIQTKSGDILELDGDAVKTDLLRQKIGRLDMDCLNASSFSYAPGQSNLCMQLWRLEELQVQKSDDDSEPNTGSKKGAGRRGTKKKPQSIETEPSNDFSGLMLMGPEDEQAWGGQERDKKEKSRSKGSTSELLKSQMSAFGDLFGSRFGNPQLKFVAVNMDELSRKPEVIEDLLENPRPWAQVMARTNGSVLEQFSKVELAEPVLVIVGKNGVIKYAGPAEGFLAPMVADELADQPDAGPATEAAAGQPAQPADTNLPSQISSGQKSSKQPPTQAQVKIDDEEEFDPQASKLFENAKVLIRAGIKLGTPKSGVEICRRILREYPDTKYADGARQLLRKLPDRFQKRYKITNEELGL